MAESNRRWATRRAVRRLIVSVVKSTALAVKVSRSAGVVAIAAMVATPLFVQGEVERRWLAYVVVIGFFVAATAASWLVHDVRAVWAAVVVMTISLAVEVVGSRTGFPFGDYEYGSALQPKLLGVPLLVAVAWTMITLVVYGMYEHTRLSLVGRTIAGACSITAWDVFLDPQMVAEGYWTWQQRGASFRGIPLVNYGGWFITAVVMLVLVHMMMTVATGRRAAQQHHDVIQAEHTARSLASLMYLVISVLSTIGFLLFFADGIVALVGAFAMGSCWTLSRVAAVRRVVS